MGIEEAKAAPAFSLKDADGKQVRLADFKGKDVILYFYPRDDTPGCTKEAQGFRDLWKKIQKRGAVVIGVSPDGEAAHQKFIEKYDLPFPLLCDPEKSVMKNYGAFVQIEEGIDGRPQCSQPSQRAACSGVAGSGGSS